MKKISFGSLKSNKLDLVILVGGKGTRIKQYLKGLPKPMAKFNNKYFIEYLIQNFSKYSFNKIYILTGLLFQSFYCLQFHPNRFLTPFYRYK